LVFELKPLPQAEVKNTAKNEASDAKTRADTATADVESMNLGTKCVQ